MKLLVVGGNGYIGSSLVLHLLEKHIVDVVDAEWFGGPVRDLCWAYRPYKMDVNLHIAYEYDVILLFAGHSSVAMCNNDPMGAIHNNVMVFNKLVDSLWSHQKLIYASSSCVYGEAEHATEDTVVKPVDGLSHTKAFMDHIAVNCGKQVYGLRLGSVGGWSKNFRKDLAINSMTMDAINEGNLTVYNDWCRRPFVGIPDIERTVDAILELEGPPGIYNVGSFNNSFGEIANGIVEITGAKLELGRVGSSTYNFTMDWNKVEKTYGITMECTLESIVEGIMDDPPTTWLPRERIPNG